MFQFQNSGLGAKEPDILNSLPNGNGQVRTFKEDFENLGKKVPAEDFPETETNFSRETGKKSFSEPAYSRNEFAETPPAASSTENISNNPFQSAPTLPPLSPANSEHSDFKSPASQSFFAEKPLPEENVFPEQRNNPLLSPKSKNKLFLPLAIILIVVIAGAGFSYYWFYIKNNSSSTSPAPASETAPATSQAAPIASPDSQNKNLRNLIIDTSTSQNSDAIKNPVTQLANDFVSTASENDLIEVKMLSKDKQPIGKKDFFSGFGVTIPDSVMMKLSEDYSLFVRKEGGAAKLGLAFKTITSSGLAEEMKNWEPTIPGDLNSLYIGQTPTFATPSFNSGQYKNADIRYFNFSSPVGASLDYSIISNFLVIGSSRDTTRAILDYMAEK